MKGAIDTTKKLADLVWASIPRRYHPKKKHVATKVFQALRIAVNRELDNLVKVLTDAPSVLASGARVCVITFHSLEDRIVKRFMRDISSRPKLPAGLPVMEADIEVPFRLVSKPVVAGTEELSVNPRSRSARLRVLERRL